MTNPTHAPGRPPETLCRAAQVPNTFRTLVHVLQGGWGLRAYWKLHLRHKYPHAACKRMLSLFGVLPTTLQATSRLPGSLKLSSLICRVATRAVAAAAARPQTAHPATGRSRFPPTSASPTFGSKANHTISVAIPGDADYVSNLRTQSMMMREKV